MGAIWIFGFELLCISSAPLRIFDAGDGDFAATGWPYSTFLGRDSALSPMDERDYSYTDVLTGCSKCASHKFGAGICPRTDTGQ